MKITIYTVNDCQFSKQEKDYLASHQIQYEEKNLETNKEFLTEMLAVSNNFAGTPVTKIEKDDGQIVILKGFTQADFDSALGLTPVPVTKPETTEAQTVVTAPTMPTMPAPTPAPIAEIKPTEPMTPPVEPIAPPVPVMPAEPTPVINPTMATPEPTVVDPQLNSILNNLQQQANLNPTQPQSVNPIPAAPPIVEPTTTPPTPTEVTPLSADSSNVASAKLEASAKVEPVSPTVSAAPNAAPMGAIPNVPDFQDK